MKCILHQSPCDDPRELWREHSLMLQRLRGWAGVRGGAWRGLASVGPWEDTPSQDRVRVERCGQEMWVCGTRTRQVWAVRIGLEVHAQMLARTKLFSNAPGTWRSLEAVEASAQADTAAVLADAFGAPPQSDPSADAVWPNAAVALMDAAVPGSLPRLSRHAVEQALLLHDASVGLDYLCV